MVGKTCRSATQSETGICRQFRQGQGMLTLPSQQASKGLTNHTLKMMDYEISPSFWERRSQAQLILPTVDSSGASSIDAPIFEKS